MLLKFFESYGRGYDATCETLEVMCLPLCSFWNYSSKLFTLRIISNELSKKKILNRIKFIIGMLQFYSLLEFWRKEFFLKRLIDKI